jgi:hypothetical protein
VVWVQVELLDERHDLLQKEAVDVAFELFEEFLDGRMEGADFVAE